MGLFTDSTCFDMLAILTALLLVLYTWIKLSYNYWSSRNIITPDPQFLIGNAANVVLQKEQFGVFAKHTYNFLKNNKAKHGGCYLLTMPIYMPVDLDIIKNIMQNDFDHFVDRGVYFNEESDPLSAHLFSIEGTKWKNLRAKLSPTFTSGKMKMMFATLAKCGDQLVTEMDKNLGGKDGINIKEILIRFTTDIIGNCAFGIECNSLENPDNDFNKYSKLAFTETFISGLKGFLTFVQPNLMRKLGVSVVHSDLSKFFLRIVRATTDYREKNNVYRRDFMHLLLQLKNRGDLFDDENVTSADNKSGLPQLTFNEIAAQAFIFFLAGFETSSTTMTFCLFELVQNPDVQEKLREEVQRVLAKYDGKITYEGLQEMYYMEKVINETLRKYPPVPILNRICTKSYKVPGTDLVLEQGTKVFVPVLGIQHDPEYFPDPDKFDPERFSEENKSGRHPYAYFPFGEGPRICIGLRFGIMETKVGLSALLRNYRFSINSKTALPLAFDPRSFILSTQGGIWLDYKRV